MVETTISQIKAGTFFTLKPIEEPKESKCTSAMNTIAAQRNTRLTSLKTSATSASSRATRRFTSTSISNDADTIHRPNGDLRRVYV